MKLNRFLLLDADPANKEGGGTVEPKQAVAPQGKLQPTKFREPTADELKVDFKLDDSDSEFLPEPTDKEVKAKATEPTAKQPEVKKEESVVTQTEIVKHPETKVEPTEAKETEGKKPGMLAKLQATKDAGTRDYTGFSEAEVKVLKNMSKESYEFVAPVLKERKSLEQLKTATYLQHPDAYKLSPEFVQNQQLTSQAQREASVWEEQLMKMRKGEEWTPPIGMDNKGNFIFGEKRAASLQDEEQVRLALSKCLQVKQTAEERLHQLPQQFQQIAQQDLVNINEERSKRFDWVADPKLLDVELEVEGVGKQKISQVKDYFKGLFPVYQQNTIGVEVAADLFVSMIIYKQQLQMAESERQVAETLKEEATRVEPTSSLRSSPKKAINGVTEFSLEGLPT